MREEIILEELYKLYIELEPKLQNLKVLDKVPMKKKIPGVGRSLLELLKERLQNKGISVSDFELFNILWDLQHGKHYSIRRKLMEKYPRLINYYFEPGLSWRHEWWLKL